MNGVYAAGYFLFSIFFSIVTFVLWVRLALRYFHVSTLNSVSQMVYRLTEPVVSPIRQLLNQLHIRHGRYDWPCLMVLVGVEILKFVLIASVFFHGVFPWLLLLLYPIADIVIQGFNILFYAILIRVILSWVNPALRTPLSDILIIITEPTLGVVRRYIPDVAGLDFSPFIVLVVIKMITLFISASMPLNLL